MKKRLTKVHKITNRSPNKRPTQKIKLVKSIYIKVPTHLLLVSMIKCKLLGTVGLG